MHIMKLSCQVLGSPHLLNVRSGFFLPASLFYFWLRNGIKHNIRRTQWIKKRFSKK